MNTDTLLELLDKCAEHARDEVGRHPSDKAAQWADGYLRGYAKGQASAFEIVAKWVREVTL